MTTRWQEAAGHDGGADYQRRMDALAATRSDIHGEADLVERVARDVVGLDAPGRVLDAGCGTGRVGIELVRRSWDVVGVDLDPSMLAVARDRDPATTWLEHDLAAPDLVGSAGALAAGSFDVVVAAGNVVPLLAAGSEAAAIANLGRLVRPGGVVVAGFGLDPAHLPLDHVPVTLADHDRWCAAAGLDLVDRLATWEGRDWHDPDADRGYAVSIHRRP